MSLSHINIDAIPLVHGRLRRRSIRRAASPYLRSHWSYYRLQQDYLRHLRQERLGWRRLQLSPVHRMGLPMGSHSALDHSIHKRLVLRPSYSRSLLTLPPNRYRCFALCNPFPVRDLWVLCCVDLYPGKIQVLGGLR